MIVKTSSGRRSAKRKKLLSKFRKVPAEVVLLRRETTRLEIAGAKTDPVALSKDLLLQAEAEGLDVDELKKTLDDFRRESIEPLMRSSKKKYVEALRLAYTLYLVFAGRPAVRDQFVASGLGAKVRKNANLFQEMLRLLIDYSDPPGSRAGARALARDAGAIEMAFRRKIGPEELKAKLLSGELGLEGLYAELKTVRSAERAEVGVKAPGPRRRVRDRDQVDPSEPVEPEIVESPLRRPPKTEPSSSADQSSQSPQIVWSDGLSTELICESTKRANDFIALGRVDPHSSQISVRRVYLTEYGSLDKKKRAELRDFLMQAGVIKKRVRPKRS